MQNFNGGFDIFEVNYYEYLEIFRNIEMDELKNIVKRMPKKEGGEARITTIILVDTFSVIRNHLS